MAALTESPFEVPVTQWVAPERATVAEAEPNDSFGAAQPVNPNDELAVTIGQNGDTDWFRVQVLQGGTLTVRAPTPAGRPSMSASASSTPTPRSWSTGSSPRVPAASSSPSSTSPAPAPTGCSSSTAANDASSTDAFAVDLSYAVQPDGFEPNDRIDLARHVPLDGTFPLNILPKGDHDWFEFSTDAPGALLVASSPVPEAIDGTFRLLNADGAEQVYWIAAPRPGGDTVAVLDLPKPGVYYLEIADGNNDARSTEPLTLTTRFAKSPDLYEPNDSMAQAMPVRDESEHTMAIFPTRDHDFLALDIVQPGELTVSIETPPENLDLTFRVLDANGAEAQYWTLAPRPGGDLFGTFDAARPGRYFLEFADGNNDAGSIDPFTLNLELHRQPRCLRAQRLDRHRERPHARRRSPLHRSSPRPTATGSASPSTSPASSPSPSTRVPRISTSPIA